jgi:hypothetical protein
MSSVVLPATELPSGPAHPAILALRTYLRAVTEQLDIGLESCTIDHDTPVSAYVALDTRHPEYPDRDLALLWDERHGWAAAIESHSGEELIVLRYLAGDTITPPPSTVAGFIAALHADDHTLGQPHPPHLRPAGPLDDLTRLLHRVTLKADPARQ